MVRVIQVKSLKMQINHLNYNINLPFTISSLDDVDELLLSVKNLEQLLGNVYEKFTIKLGNNSFLIEPHVYCKPLIEELFN